MVLEKANAIFRKRARELRKHSTLAEVLLWNQLKNKKFMGLDFDRQIVVNNRYIVDFCSLQHDIVIEIDGISHDDKVDYDKERDSYLINLGFKLIHIYDLDVKTNMEGVLHTIAENVLNSPSFRRGGTK